MNRLNFLKLGLAASVFGWLVKPKAAKANTTGNIPDKRDYYEIFCKDCETEEIVSSVCFKKDYLQRGRIDVLERASKRLVFEVIHKKLPREYESL